MAAKDNDNTNPSGEESIVAKGSIFRGSLLSDCPVKVSGEVEGELTAPSLDVEKSGRVHGKVEVDDLRSEGELSGEIDAKAVSLAGRVRDNTSIKAQTLEVKLDSESSDKLSVTFGQSRLEVGEQPPEVTSLQREASGSGGESLDKGDGEEAEADKAEASKQG